MGLLGSVINLAVQTVKLVKEKAGFSDIAMHLLTEGPRAIMQAIGFARITREEQLADALAEFDARTGTDVGAWDVIRDLPQDKEEVFFDHLKGAIEVLAKNKLKIPGYYIDPDAQK